MQPEDVEKELKEIQGKENREKETDSQHKRGKVETHFLFITSAFLLGITFYQIKRAAMKT